MSRDPAARAARLLRWYPRPWRERYGAEFAELLVSDIEERPRSAGRAADVARGGLTARLAGAGLAGGPLPAPGEAVTSQLRYQQVSASLGSLLGVLAVFLVAALALASALVIDWQFPVAVAGPTALMATRVISAALLVLLALAGAAALPVLGVLAARFAGRAARRRLRGPAAVLLASVAFLVTGGRHFGNGWPGTGGHGSFVPAGLAAFEWASSLFVSAYWVHPGSLAAFPRAEVGWMAVSPLALAAAVTAAAVLIRRAGLPPGLLAFEVRLATAACTVLPVVFAAAAGWVASSGPRQPSFHAGLIDLAATVVLAAALPLAIQAVRAARRELRLARITA